MERLPEDPRNFREMTEADLRRAARLVIKVQDEIDPQIRIGTPEGDFHIAITLPPDDYGRRNVLRARPWPCSWPGSKPWPSPSPARFISRTPLLRGH